MTSSLTVLFFVFHLEIFMLHDIRLHSTNNLTVFLDSDFNTGVMTVLTIKGSCANL